MCAYVTPKTRLIMLCLYSVICKKIMYDIKRDVQKQSTILLLLMMI